jgi:CRP-like cAMP-binding protein
MSAILPIEKTPLLTRLGIDAGNIPGLERVEYRDGEYIIREGEKADEFYILESGAAVVERSGGGAKDARPIVLHAAMMEEGHLEFFGEMAYFLDGVRTASIRATGRTVALRVKSETLPHLFLKAPQVAAPLFKALVERLRETTDHLVSLQQAMQAGPEMMIVGEESRVLFRAGEPAETLYQLLSGMAELEKGDGARRKASGGEEPEAFLNAAAYFEGGANRETCSAAPGSMALAYRADKKAEVVRSFPEVALAVMRGK